MKIVVTNLSSQSLYLGSYLYAPAEARTFNEFENIGATQASIDAAKTLGLFSLGYLAEDSGSLRVVSVTQEEYDAIDPKDPDTLYVVAAA